MMTSTRIMARILVALLGLTLLASLVSAECAWVLWSGNTTPWGAYETKKECEGARNVHRALAQLDAKKYPSLQVQEPSLECLPDTKITETPSTCTWMLWRSAVTMPKPTKTAFETKQECEKARDVANRAMAKTDESPFICGELDTSTQQQHRAPLWLLRRTPYFEITQSPMGTFKTHEQCERRRGADVMKREERELTYCLPDTVDPRGPKGK